MPRIEPPLTVSKASALPYPLYQLSRSKNSFLLGSHAEVAAGSLGLHRGKPFCTICPLLSYKRLGIFQFHSYSWTCYLPKIKPPNISHTTQIAPSPPPLFQIPPAQDLPKRVPVANWAQVPLPHATISSPGPVFASLAMDGEEMTGSQAALVEDLRYQCYGHRQHRHCSPFLSHHPALQSCPSPSGGLVSAMKNKPGYRTAG